MNLSTGILRKKGEKDLDFSSNMIHALSLEYILFQSFILVLKFDLSGLSRRHDLEHRTYQFTLPLGYDGEKKKNSEKSTKKTEK